MLKCGPAAIIKVEGELTPQLSSDLHMDTVSHLCVLRHAPVHANSNKKRQKLTSSKDHKQDLDKARQEVKGVS